MSVTVRPINTDEKLSRRPFGVTREEKKTFLWKKVRSWEPVSEVAALKFGSSIIALTTAGSAIAVNMYFRKFFRLGNIGRLSTYLASIGPATALSCSFNSFVMEDILVGATPCIICLQSRAVSMQAIFSCIYPCVLSPLLCASLAVPRALSPSLNAKENLLATVNHIRKKPNLFWAVLVINCAVAAALTHFQVEATMKLHLKLSKDDADN